jgi:hypothetical protein
MSDVHALIERLYALFNARELEKAATLFADDAVLEQSAAAAAAGRRGLPRIRPYVDRCLS